MKFKYKINLIIIIVLLFQVIITISFTIVNFIQEKEKSLYKELDIKLIQLDNKINNLKHYSFNYLINTGNLLQKLFKKYPSDDSIINILENNLPVFNYDKLYIVDQNLKVVYKNDKLKGGIKNLPINIYNSYHYKFPSTKFYYLKLGDKKKIVMISGYWIKWIKDKKYGIFIMIDFNNNFVKKISEEINNDISIFCNKKLVSSSTPYFDISKNRITNTKKVLKIFANRNNKNILMVNIENEDYYILKKILSTDFNNTIEVGVLKSLTDSKIYTLKLIRSILAGFIITLVFVFVLSTFLTSYFTKPIIKLNEVLNKFLKTGKLEKFKTTTGDEIGFFSKSFYNLARDLIKDREVIKNSLDKITFLNEYNEIILRNIQSGIMVINNKLRIEYCNNYFYEHLNFNKKNILNKKFIEFFNDNFKVGSKKVNLGNYFKKDKFILENVIHKVELTKTLKFYIKFIKIHKNTDNWKFLALFEDVTKAETLWQKMLQAEKITSLGVLSAGVAHEINNPLSIILSHVQYLKEVEKKKEFLNSLNWIEKETKRIALIVSKMLNFVSETKSNIGYTNLNKKIMEIIDFFNLKIKKKKISLSLELDQKIDKLKNGLKISPDNLNQIIFNLILNSIAAIDEKKQVESNFKGEIKIKTYIKGDFIFLEVYDNGIGINEKDKNYIFDPFFTTKINGTGLGLSVIYNMIKSVDGDIWFESIRGQNTTFIVKLPIYESNN